MISRYLFFRHRRAEPSSHLIQYRKGHQVRSGRGVDFWFLPLSASLVEVPVDDREQSFLCNGRSSDFQELTVQGVITYRVNAPETLAGRGDFGIDLASGKYLKEPIEQMATMVAQLAQQIVLEYLCHQTLQERAIEENELQNKIELAKQEQQFIEQQGLNERRWAEDEAQSAEIAAFAKAQRHRLHSASEADGIESDYLSPQWGQRVAIGTAETRLRLVAK